MPPASVLTTILETHRKSIITLVIVAACFLFLYNLGSKPFWDYDEATYAMVTVDTLQTGQPWTLYIQPNAWFEKPPLYFWMSMVLDRVIHHPELSYRLTAALAGIASILLTMLIVFEIR